MAKKQPVAHCKTCKAEIQWIETKAGKKHPVNKEPKKMWNYQWIPGEGRSMWVLIDCYESHFATCPDAKEHSNKNQTTMEFT